MDITGIDIGLALGILLNICGAAYTSFLIGQRRGAIATIKILEDNLIITVNDDEIVPNCGCTE